MTEIATNYLSTVEAAAWLGLSPRTLDAYRVRGGGPAFHRFGRIVRYRLADLERWAAERRTSSTSDDAGRGPEGSAWARRLRRKERDGRHPETADRRPRRKERDSPRPRRGPGEDGGDDGDEPGRAG